MVKRRTVRHKARQKRKEQFQKAHKAAKAIVYIIIVVLVTLGEMFPSVGYPLTLVSITVWVFGTNPIAYSIESCMKWTHKHDLI